MVHQFDYGWEFKANQGHECHPRSTTDVLNLTEKLQGFRPAEVLVECSFLDGLLAVHQGGGTLALLHPFRDLAGEKVAEWQLSEQDILHKNNCELPNVKYHGEWFRPFKPICTSDRRYGVFSTPYAVYAVDIGSLPAWQGIISPRAVVVASWNDNSKLRLAAQPVPLTDQDYPQHQSSKKELKVESNRIGLILRDDQHFYWHVVDLDKSFNHEIIRDEIPDLVKLPITGDAVQVLDFQGTVLILATSNGHWFWKIGDAQRNNVGEIVELGTADKDGTIVLDREVVERKYFSWKRQHIHSISDELQGDSKRKNLKLCFSRYDGATIAAEMHGVSVEQPKLSRKARPVSYGATSIQYPIGSSQSPEDKGLRELLIIAGDNGTINKPSDSDSGLGALHAGTLSAGAMADIPGLQFNDPLLILVKNDYRKEHARTIEMRSVWNHEVTATVHGIHLKSDPLAWSNFLFTCESDDDDDRVFLRRREYGIQTNGSNSHIEEWKQGIGGEFKSRVPSSG